MARRQNYYRLLEASQRGTLDLTDWLMWFLDTLVATLQEALASIDRTLVKVRFWRRFANQGRLRRSKYSTDCWMAASEDSKMASVPRSTIRSPG